MGTIPDELQKYVSASLGAGETKEGIRNALLAAGWDEAAVNGVLGFPEMPEAPEEMTRHKKRKKIGLVTAIVAVIAVAGAAATFFFLMPSHPSQPPAGPSAGQENGANGGAAAATNTAAVYSGPIASTCADSDASLGANAIYTKGSVTAVNSNGDAQTLIDYCADKTHLIEYICYESPVGSGKYGSGRTIVDCANGCLNGACVR